MLRKLLLATAATLAFAASPASAALVDFEGLSVGDNPNPLTISGATFETLGGFNYIASAGGTQSLCTSTSAASPANCSNDLSVIFDSAVSDISFTFGGNNITTVGADIGDVQIFSGATLLGVVDVIVADADIFGTFDLVSLAGFGDVTSLLISSTDAGGVLYDDFSFTPGAAVPEPATWAMMILGFGLAGGAFRRRRPQLALA